MDDLQRELGRLETELPASQAAVKGEVAAMRTHLQSDRKGGPVRLADLRIASPCKQRWADMTGDERVRVCAGCERPVFNLSEMTQAQAEAVLATRGITPCVRFYRRTDGTIMTADCPTGARRGSRLSVLAAGTALLGASPALAEPTTPEPAPTEDAPTERRADPQPADPYDDSSHLSNVFSNDVEMGIITCPAPDKRRSRLEWSSWARLGFGVASHAPDIAARSTTPIMPESSGTGEAALGADLTLGIGRDGNVRLGAFAELRTTTDPVAGGELIVEGFGRHPYRGSSGIVVRVGGNAALITTAIGVGYVTAGTSHHANHFRFIASINRSTQDPRDWSATIGAELDPIGAIGFLLR